MQAEASSYDKTPNISASITARNTALHEDFYKSSNTSQVCDHINLYILYSNLPAYIVR